MAKKKERVVVGGLKLYTVNEIAEAMEVTGLTVRRYIKNGHLEVTRLGRNIFVTEEQLKAFIEANK